MGLSVAAAHGIIGTALLAAALALGVQGLNTWESLEKARADETQMRDAKAHSTFQVYSVSWDSGANELTIKVNNTGSRTLDVTRMDVLLDGVVKTDDVTSTAVDGSASTSLWAPGTQLTLVVGSVAAEPESSIKVVAENGTSAVWVMS